MTAFALNHTHKTAIILAAGKGTRMKSELPKVLHTLDGKPLIEYVLDAVVAAQIEKAVIVVGYKSEQVKSALQSYISTHSQLQIEFVLQEPQLGTGHAVQVCNEHIADSGSTIVLLGDVPLLKAKTIHQAVGTSQQKQLDALVLSMRLEDPTGYGRMVRNVDGDLLSICEEKDADASVKKIDEVNSGIFVFDNAALKKHLFDLQSNNAQGEFYLTDLIAIMRAQNLKVDALVFDDALQFTGVNSVEQLSSLENTLRENVMRQGEVA